MEWLEFLPHSKKVIGLIHGSKGWSLDVNPDVSCGDWCDWFQ